MPLEIFIIIDNKCKTRLVCQTLVSDETLDTYIWILKCIRRATEQAPIVIFTDADPALNAAIPIVFPKTYPAHCIFHIAQNLPKNLKGKLGERWNDFIKQFYQCRNSLCKLLFKQRWNQLLNDFPTAKDYLLRTLDRRCKSWARAYLYKIFTAGIESTSRVEGYNWIIKQQLKANSTLCELVDRLDLRLKEEERWNQFYEYKQATTSNTIFTVGQDLFPTITKVLNKYLTEPINNMIRAEISQCLFVNANMIEPSDEELNREQENFQRMSDGFIEDQYDARFITLQAMIAEVGRDEVLEIWKVVDMRIAAFHISMITQRWYKDIYQDETNLQESIILNCERDTHNNESMDKGILPTRCLVTIPTTVSMLRKAVRKRNLYGHVWGLARTATLLAVEQEDNEITAFLQDYIRRKSNQNMSAEISVINKRPAIKEIERNTNDETPENDQIPAANDETPTVNAIDEISNNVHVIQMNKGDTGQGKRHRIDSVEEDSVELESSNQIEEDETEQDNEIIKTNLENVKNPNKAVHKGRPSKRRYLSSVKKEQGSRGGPKTRGSYRCRVCNQVGHNAAFHKSTGDTGQGKRHRIDSVEEDSVELESSNQIEEDETEQDNEIIKTNLENVKNPNKAVHKGRPSKRRYLSSVKKEQGSRGGPKTRGSYRCRVCNQVGHNAAFHKSTGK
ncbi:hypothetical protein Glove_245g27 [Diversispora epigaea]|uniref:MULE transposase domain-containing protein n=1 Tax=Diversispora epigaea TaxID=1348612 RepID=A0A397ID22_9GLOM|nr:hypothetical protein Glove_245g27 [Diversispora epigaea]